MKKVLLAFLIIVVLLVCLTVGAMYLGYTISNGDTILKNVSLNGIAVENMTREEARNALEKAGWNEKVTSALKVNTLGDISFEIDPVKAVFEPASFIFGLVIPDVEHQIGAWFGPYG